MINKIKCVACVLPWECDGLPSSFPLDQRKVKGEMHLASSHRIEKRIVEERKTHEIGASRKERARIRGGETLTPRTPTKLENSHSSHVSVHGCKGKGTTSAQLLMIEEAAKPRPAVFFLCGWEAMYARECVFWVNWSLLFLRVSFSLSRVCGCPFFVCLVIFFTCFFLKHVFHLLVASVFLMRARASLFSSSVLCFLSTSFPPSAC